MTNKEILNKIKIMLGMEVKVELTEATLEDGTVLSYTELVSGATIDVQSSDGSFIPCPIGSYVLTDGTIITVSVEGIIDVITMPTETEVPEPTPEIEVEVENADVPTIETVTEELKGLNTRITDIETNLASIMDILNQLTSSTKMSTDTITKLSSQVEELSKEPSAKPVFTVDTNKDTEDYRFSNLELLKKK